MSVTQWGAPGQWTTNYSAIAYSEDNGENWNVAPNTVRYNQPWSGNQNFQQSAFVRPGDGYVYSYGTPNGRQGAAYVSRVAEKDILDLTKYEYYSKGTAGGWFGIGATPAGWYRNNPAAATPVFGQDTGACGVANAGNQVSEMSVQYNKSLKKYVVLYGDQFNNIVMRTSDTPAGHLVGGEGADGPAERRHLRADDASVVAVDDGHRHRSVLEPVAVVGVQRDADAAPTSPRSEPVYRTAAGAVAALALCFLSAVAADPVAPQPDTPCPSDYAGAMTWPADAKMPLVCASGGLWQTVTTPAPPSDRWLSVGPAMTLHGEGRRNPDVRSGDWTATPQDSDEPVPRGPVDRRQPRCCQSAPDRGGAGGPTAEVHDVAQTLRSDIERRLSVDSDIRLRRRWGWVRTERGNRTACPKRMKPLSLLCAAGVVIRRSGLSSAPSANR